jgi:hypothetical protein
LAGKSVHVVTYEDSREAERGRLFLRRLGIESQLVVEETESPPAYHLLVPDHQATQAVQALQAEDAREEGQPPPHEPEKIHCPRCGSEAGVVVGEPPAWQRFLFQQVFAVPHLKRPCSCRSCGLEWRQFV